MIAWQYIRRFGEILVPIDEAADLGLGPRQATWAKFFVRVREPGMALTKQESERLIRCALDAIKSDLIITGEKLVNVCSGEVLEGMEIAVIAETFDAESKLAMMTVEHRHLRRPRVGRLDD